MELQNYILGFQKDTSGFINQCFTFLHIPDEHFFSKDDAIEYVQNCGINIPLKQLHTRIPHGFSYKIAVLRKDLNNQLYHFVVTNTAHNLKQDSMKSENQKQGTAFIDKGEQTELLII